MNIDFLKVFKTPSHAKTRLGSKYDGGYVIVDNVCDYDLFISCGISDNIDFELDFLNKYNNVKCLAFDGTISDIPTNNHNITFIKKNIGCKNDDKTTTLRDYFKNYNNIFLKMDIETFEFIWLHQMSVDELQKFAQIAIEIHFPFTLAEGVFTQLCGVIPVNDKLSIIKKLFKNHKLFHIHGNSHCGECVYAGKKLPNIIECTFVRNDLITDNELSFDDIPDPKLDNVNIVTDSEIKFTLN
jgi:hypothetical protein